MTLHVERLGEGPPLVLLHGFAMHGGLFATVAPALARRHRVHVVDLPGHGFSADAGAATLAAIAREVVDAVAAGEPPIVLGWSFGGLVAQEMARAGAARVLVLVATSPRFVSGPDWPHAMSAATLARFGDELRVACRATLLRFLTLQVHGSEDGRTALAALRGALFARAAPSPATLSQVLRLLAETDLRHEASRIDVPALVVAGARDTLAPAAAGAWLARVMPGARYVEIPGAAHAPFLSHRDAFVDAVSAFLDDQSSLPGA
jgi:pimeloyl-[acyl-carrier protein] methyl ester esterase